MEPPAEQRSNGFGIAAVRPLLLAGGLGLIWFVCMQDGGVEGDVPAWGVAIVLAVRLLADLIGAWVVVSTLRLAFALGRLGLAYLRVHRHQGI